MPVIYKIFILEGLVSEDTPEFCQISEKVKNIEPPFLGRIIADHMYFARFEYNY